jgi:oxaloacetate decarboxylase alpha subunit
MSQSLSITDVVLRDAHQSLFATRMRLDDMLPIAAQLDEIGYWSLETWGGATFDSCIRYLGEDPWVRLRELKAVMPKTPMQMLLRGQNLLGYRHYADDVVDAFVDRAHTNGMDIFRVFDAMNDIRNFQQAVKACVNVGAHAQGTLSYTTSPVHTLDNWVDLAKRLEDLGCHSLCIKDMSGLLKPYDAEILVSRIKSECDLPLALHSHATTGLSTATAVKAIEAGLDILDTSISSMSQTYGHTPTETVVAMLEGTARDTNLSLEKFEPIATHFRNVRKKYAQFEGSLKGVDARILLAQVPGGMLTNMESQLKEQGASDRFDEVLLEIPKVREDLGFIPLVTPTSQIVGTQAVLNVLTGERYKSISKETAGILKGEYGQAPAPLNAELQKRVLNGNAAITCRPADLLQDEIATLTSKLVNKARESDVMLSEAVIDDVLTYALFPQVGWQFLKNRGNADYFEPIPTGEVPEIPSTAVEGPVDAFSVSVNGELFDVQVGPTGSITQIESMENARTKTAPSIEVSPSLSSQSFEAVSAPLAGNIFKVEVKSGHVVSEGDILVILEAMKMETEIRAARDGIVQELLVKEGDSVAVGTPILNLI